MILAADECIIMPCMCIHTRTQVFVIHKVRALGCHCSGILMKRRGGRCGWRGRATGGGTGVAKGAKVPWDPEAVAVLEKKGVVHSHQKRCCHGFVVGT